MMEVMTPLLQNNVMIKAVLGLVVISTVILLSIATVWLVKLFNSKSMRAKLKAELDDTEKRIDSVKEDINTAEGLINYTNDETIRKMLCFEKDRNTTKLHELTAKRDYIKSKLNK